MNELIFWPIWNAVNFAFLPPSLQVACTGLGGLLWNTYISMMARGEAQDPGKRKFARARARECVRVGTGRQNKVAGWRCDYLSAFMRREGVSDLKTLPFIAPLSLAVSRARALSLVHVFSLLQGKMSSCRK